MSNEELILQKLTKIEEKYDKDIEQLKKTTDLIAMTVANQQVDI